MLSVVGSVVRAAAELCIMGLGVGDDAAIRILASSPIITTLLPLLLSHVSSVALSDPRVTLGTRIDLLSMGGGEWMIGHFSNI